MAARGVNERDREIVGSQNEGDLGTAEDDAIDASDWYADGDSDSYGDATISAHQCYAPAGFVSDDTDCDDTNGATNPDTPWYADTDGDGFGDPGDTVLSCTGPVGFVGNGLDCDDVSPTAADTFPGAAPNDNASACMKDVDGDDYGDHPPPAGGKAGTDCNDTGECHYRRADYRRSGHVAGWSSPPCACAGRRGSTVSCSMCTRRLSARSTLNRILPITTRSPRLGK